MPTEKVRALRTRAMPPGLAEWFDYRKMALEAEADAAADIVNALVLLGETAV